MNSIRHKLMWAWLCIVPAAAAAQPRAMNLQECIRAALDNNLALRAGQISVEKAEDLQGTAFDIEKTDISLSQDPTSGGGPDNGITVSQAFDFPTVYAARRKYLKALTAAERGSLEVARNEVVKEVTSCYYSLVHARSVAKIMQEQDSLYAKFLAIATAKYEAGETGLLEKMNAERMYNENRLEMQRAERACRAAALALRNQMNTGEDVAPADTALTAMQTEGALEPVDFGRTPLGGMYASRKTASEKSLKLAKQGYLPGISIGLTGQLLIKGFNPYDVQRERFEQGNFMGFEVGVSVPLFWGAQRAKVKAARRDVELAEVAQRQAEQTMEKDYRDCAEEYQRAKKALDYYRRQGSAQAAEMVRLSQVSYEKGEIGYVEYIQNMKTAAETRVQHANAINDYNQAVIMLNYLKGNK